MIPALIIRAFRPEDQAPVKQLILDGLVEHWGFLDPHLNPDLNDIQESYRHATFLVACHDQKIVACGALVPRDKWTAEIVRVSVHSAYRRQRIGTLLVQNLLQEAKKQGFSKVILETTASWSEVIAFYLRNGFDITYQVGEDVYFSYDFTTKN